MLLSKPELALAKLVSKDELRGLATNMVCVDRNASTVTDGFILVTVGHHESYTQDSNVWPSADGFEHRVLADGPVEERVLVARNAALAALKAIPNKSTIPVLQFAALGKDGRVHVNPLDGKESFDCGNAKSFPNWRAVMPAKDRKARATVTLDAKRLKLLVDYFAQHAAGFDTRVFKLTVYDEQSAVKLEAKTQDGQEITALLMPCRA